MARTHFLNSYVTKVDTLNDQLWYYLFATEELNKQLDAFSEKASKENYTTDLFKTNPHASRIHIPVASLPIHQKENKNLTFGAYFATCYEIAAKHIRMCFDTLKTYNALTRYSWDKRKEPEGNLIKLLTEEGLPGIHINITDTITYLRHRRNHYTHILETPNTPLANFMTTACTRLNVYWGRPRTTIHLDFTKVLVRDFTQEETIELIKLLRICLIVVDQHVAGLLNTNSVIRELVSREYAAKPARLNNHVLQQRCTKVIKIAQTELLRNLTTAEVTPFVTTIGVR